MTDAAAVIHALSVVEQTGFMPLTVGDEVRRLAGDSDRRFAEAAQAALHSVSAKAAHAPPMNAQDPSTAFKLMNDRRRGGDTRVVGG